MAARYRGTNTANTAGSNIFARVLVVDDKPAQVEIVRSYLEAENYDVLAASDAPAALEIARREKPGLVVLDVMLPGLDGIEG